MQKREHRTDFLRGIGSAAIVALMISSPGIGHSGRLPEPPRRAPLALGTAAMVVFLLLGCVRGTYFLTRFEANCSSEPDSSKPCLKSDDPAFSAHPIIIAIISCVFWMILLCIPARFCQPAQDHGSWGFTGPRNIGLDRMRDCERLRSCPLTSVRAVSIQAFGERPIIGRRTSWQMAAPYPLTLTHRHGVS